MTEGETNTNQEESNIDANVEIPKENQGNEITNANGEGENTTVCKVEDQIIPSDIKTNVDGGDNGNGNNINNGDVNNGDVNVNNNDGDDKDGDDNDGSDNDGDDDDSNDDESQPKNNDDEEEDDDDDDDDDDEEEESNYDESEDDNVIVTIQDDVVKNAAIDAAKRLYHAQVHSTPTGNIAAMRTTGEIFSLGNRIPWEIVNPMGVHPKDSTKSIFSYDISTLPNTIEAKPWTAPDVDNSDWFNYGFNETSWEKYRKKMLKVIKNKKYESKISVLSEQTRQTTKK